MSEIDLEVIAPPNVQVTVAPGGVTLTILTGPTSVNVNGTTYLASYGDATPQVIFDLPAGFALSVMDVEVTETWDGIGAAIQIGVVGEAGRYFADNETELTALACFSKDFTELGPKQIVVTITPGGPASQGKVHIQVSTTTAGT
jgi:hypothetical protein